MQVTVNGQVRGLGRQEAGLTVEAMLGVLEIKADRVAVERNGEIVARGAWATTPVGDGDRFEIVHFVGGGAR